MTSNFYITEVDMGKSRAEVKLLFTFHLGMSIKVHELNPYVDINPRVDDITEDYFRQFRVQIS